MSDPKIVMKKNTCYQAFNINKIIDENGHEIQPKKITALCRCGLSKTKPFCDGEHIKVGLDEVKSDDRVLSNVKDYVGKNIIIHFDLGICSHNTNCVKALKNVFDTDKRPWINPDGASIEEIIKVIEACPSGALSYTIEGKKYNPDYKEATIILEKNGPIQVKGEVALVSDQENDPPMKNNYTLCRCGHSKNKPFCDGSHHTCGFTTD